VVNIVNIIMLVGILLLSAGAGAYIALQPWHDRKTIQQLLTEAGIDVFTNASYPLHVKAEHRPNNCDGCPVEGVIREPPGFCRDKNEIRIYLAVDGTATVSSHALLRPICLLAKQNKHWRATGWYITEPRQVHP